MTRPPKTDADRQRFEALLAPQLDMAFRYATRLTRNREEAMDLVQEAAINAFQGFHTFAEDSNFRAWFLRILTNRFYQSRRREHRIETTAIDEAEDLFLYEAAKKHGMSTEGDDPAGQLFDLMTREMVESAIDRLPDEYRSVTSLYFLADMSYDEIAQTLEIPIGTVRSRLHRGREQLQRMLWQVAIDSGIIKEDEA